MAHHTSPFLSSSPSETGLQLTDTSSPLCHCCHLLPFHHLFCLSPSISDPSDVSLATAACTKTPWAVLFTPAFCQPPQEHDSPTAQARLTEYSAFSNHLCSSCSFHLGGVTNFARFTPCSLKYWYSHSPQHSPLYGEAAPPTRASLWTQDAAVPLPLWESFICSVLHIIFAVDQQLQKVVRVQRIRAIIFSHERVYLRQLLA